MSDQPPEMPTLAELVESCYDSLFRYAIRLSGSAADAEDLTQQAFLTAQRKLDQLRKPEHSRAWLFTIVRNIFLKQVRRSSVASQLPLDAISEPITAENDSSVDAEDLQLILNELPEEFRAPLILFYFQELSYREIAVQLDVPIGTVMSRLSRAREHLRKRLQVPEESGSSNERNG